MNTEGNMIKCAAGCKHFYGGEIRHDPGCFYYAESLSQRYDRMDDEIARLVKERDDWRNKYLMKITEPVKI